MLMPEGDDAEILAYDPMDGRVLLHTSLSDRTDRFIRHTATAHKGLQLAA
jgi:hypothetical protein